MSTHSRLSPSSAKRWISCPGSVALSAKAPVGKSSPHAAEGTVAHTLAEDLVTGKTDELDLLSSVGTFVKDKRSGLDIEIIEEMVSGAILYRDLIAARKAEMGKVQKPAPVVSKTEVKVVATSVDEEVKGTADHILYRKGDRLYVDDYKFGAGVAVSPVENDQAAIYAIGAMDGEAGWAYNDVEISIIQPRDRAGDTVKTWTAPIAWLKEYREKLKKAVAATRQEAAKLVPGDHCRWCPAKAFCPSLYETVQKEASVDFALVVPTSPALPEVRLMTPDKLAAALKWEGAINSWFEGVSLAVQELLASGTPVPGWKLVDKRATRAWKDVNVVAEKFGAQAWEKKLLSPAKLEKVLGKAGKKLIEEFTFKPEVGKTIAPDEDPRPQSVSSAADDFAPVKREPIWPA